MSVARSALNYGGQKRPGPSEQDDRPVTLDTLRRKLFAMIDRTPNLDWLLLTKRPENIARMMPAYNGPGGLIRPNVWLGTTAENQRYADLRIPVLARIPAVVHFVSLEPLLQPIRLADYLADLQWVIVGGESGIDARPMHPRWVQHLRRQCRDAGVPFFFKQWGQWQPFQGGLGTDNYDHPSEPKIPESWRNMGRYICMRSDGKLTTGYDGTDAEFMVKVGKEKAGHLLLNEQTDRLETVQQFPCPSIDQTN